ncbi:MAG TPA: fasciclin domain-containing protein [Caulobacteraceae bacterium]|jgi:uncharacterized surface protein with fasciclin (FAS1) repeats|nr:fasciclin domain-containing protein [Caulobacteraceae bacterium]
MTFFRFAAVVATALLVAAPAMAQPAPAPAAPAVAPAPAPAPTGDVIQTLQARGTFTTFLKLSDAAGITETLKTLPSITLFVPDDAAFAKLAPGIVDGWLNTDDKDGLQRLMLYHVINARITSAQIIGHYSAIQTVAGSSVQIDGNQPDGKVHVDAAIVVQNDIPATNGNIFVLDRVLAPR